MKSKILMVWLIKSSVIIFELCHLINMKYETKIMLQRKIEIKIEKL